MAKRKISKVNQFALFPDQMKPGPQEFAKNLWEQGLVAKTIKRKRPAKGKPKTINVKAEIANAYNVLYNAKGVNIEGFVDILKNAPVLKAESIVANNAIVSHRGKTAREMQQIGKAVKAIVYFVERQRKRQEMAKVFAPDRASYRGKNLGQKHLKSITGK